MLHVSSHLQADGVVVVVDGRLDGSPPCQTLSRVVKGCLDEGHRRFVIDLEQVEWMSSCGIGCLISAYTSVRREGGTLALRAPNDRVRAALEITDLVPAVFEVLPGSAEAVGS